jgi:hypothetical protein
MTRSVYVLTCLAALVAASQAEALQLTNRDTAEHKIALTEPAGTQEVLIKPSQVIDGICKTGCTMKMADGEEYEFDGNEVVSIEEGLMFLDEPAEGNSAGSSGTDEDADAEKSGNAAESPAGSPAVSGAGVVPNAEKK